MDKFGTKPNETGQNCNGKLNLNCTPSKKSGTLHCASMAKTEVKKHVQSVHEETKTIGTRALELTIVCLGFTHGTRHVCDSLPANCVDEPCGSTVRRDRGNRWRETQLNLQIVQHKSQNHVYATIVCLQIRRLDSITVPLIVLSSIPTSLLLLH